MNRLKTFLVSGLGTGLLPGPTGTYGSAGTCLLFLLVAMTIPGCPIAVTGAMAATAVLFSLFCVAWGKFAEEKFGKKDPGQVTADEWAGQAVALLFLPWDSVPVWVTVLTAFVAFRLFDILKPFPCRRLEKLPFGWGVLLDDLAAGVYANTACQLLLRTVLRGGDAGIFAGLSGGHS